MLICTVINKCNAGSSCRSIVLQVSPADSRLERQLPADIFQTIADNPLVDAESACTHCQSGVSPAAIEINIFSATLPRFLVHPVSRGL